VNAFNEESIELSQDKRVQKLPLVVYQDNVRTVIGEATVTGDDITYELYADMPPELKELLKDRPLPVSAHEVFDHDTPLFPANAYEVNEPLAEQRLIDAILNIQSFKITDQEGETHG
jgi:hypothetical protein